MSETAPHSAIEDQDAPPPYRGVIVIEWPPPAGTSPYACMNGWGIAITEAVSGKPITTCSGIAVRADVHGLVTADLTLFTDADGEPLLGSAPVPVMDGGEMLTGTFPFVVSEMRVRSAG